MSTTAIDMTTTGSSTSKPKPVQLRTGRDYSLTTAALEHRAAELEKLAKKTREEGYQQEARTIEGDAGAIREYILPRFKEQQELPLVSSETLRAAIKTTLHAIIHRFAVSSDSAATAAAKQQKTEPAYADRWQGKREEDLAAAIARAVEAYGIEIAEAAFAAGLAAREATSMALAHRSVFALREATVE